MTVSDLGNLNPVVINHYSHGGDNYLICEYTASCNASNDMSVDLLLPADIPQLHLMELFARAINIGTPPTLSERWGSFAGIQDLQGNPIHVPTIRPIYFNRIDTAGSNQAAAHHDWTIDRSPPISRDQHLINWSAPELEESGSPTIDMEWQARFLIG